MYTSKYIIYIYSMIVLLSEHSHISGDTWYVRSICLFYVLYPLKNMAGRKLGEHMVRSICLFYALYPLKNIRVRRKRQSGCKM